MRALQAMRSSWRALGALMTPHTESRVAAPPGCCPSGFHAQRYTVQHCFQKIPSVTAQKRLTSFGKSPC